MPKIAVFEKNVTRYDTWFEKHQKVYTSELLAVKQMIPDGVGVEVGTGTGYGEGSFLVIRAVKDGLP